jgi:tRNA synthetases class I (C) catalytic domain
MIFKLPVPIIPLLVVAILTLLCPNSSSTVAAWTTLLYSYAPLLSKRTKGRLPFLPSDQIPVVNRRCATRVHKEIDTSNRQHRRGRSRSSSPRSLYDPRQYSITLHMSSVQNDIEEPSTLSAATTATATTTGNESILKTQSMYPSQRKTNLVLTMYNSRTRQKEPFVAQQELLLAQQQQQQQQQTVSENNDVNNDKTKNLITRSPKKITVTMYTCGPTVYDYAHIGNFRAFLTYDLLKRVLLYLGYNVLHVCNITDVDDKIIQKANAQELPIGQIQTITKFYTEKFQQDLRALSCIPATYYPRATDHIPAMIRFVQDLATPMSIATSTTGVMYENNDDDDDDDDTIVDSATTTRKSIPPLAYEAEDGSWYFDTQQYQNYN